MWNKLRLCLLIAAFVSVLVGWIGGWHRAMNTGNTAYSRGDYPAARTAFQQAAQDKLTNPIAHYNLGTTLYQEGKFSAATRAFQASLSRYTGHPEGSLNLAHIYYNLGNAQFKAGDLRSAIAAYEQTLRLDPQDADALHNLELARQRLKQQENNAQQQANRNASPKNEPNDIGKSELRQILEHFSENENRLRQKRLQEQRKSGYRREKDW